MKVAVLAGDGIGPEVTEQALKVLNVIAGDGLPLEFEPALVGGTAYDRTGHPLPPETLRLARDADAILFGAEGGFQYETLPRGLRPGDALLALRQELDLFANFRPVVAYPELFGASPLKPSYIDGLDLLIVRELTGDLYFGEPRGIVEAGGKRVGINTMRYDEDEIRRIAHVAFRAARGRRSRVCSVDKANVLESMELWRTVLEEVARDYPDVELEHLYIDAATMSLLRAPLHFDVIVTGNLFGDILSDEASMLTGSIGMLPSASIGNGRKGLYEPVHGCAPDIAGKDVANPIASILSAAMMLRMSFDADDAATRIERAVRRVLASGYRTADIVEPGTKRVGTAQMGDLVVAAMA
ncbi:3-isopropylmalate dehydrogenase [Burkholderia sp. Ac-20379]|uniref:3-isopropylmalate dehydrogenase n=1 Tax=Burkholderia sp. Ac-20379 TaxID=2703900 RepID=UPI00197FD717|nr:3-isopropylmalate dehydrogenase [Burkholderia sp. Ac-20379]MBN3723296.1 3-isopropylmalate dehydrogenase [Burkholderia sp. Ac-20379]